MCNGKFELFERDVAIVIGVTLGVREILGYFVEFVVGKSAHGVEATLEFGEIDPGSDGCLEKGNIFAIFIGVIAKIGVTWLDKNDGLKPDFSKYGCEKYAGVDAVGLTRAIDFVKEADMLHIGVGRWIGGTGDGRVGDAVRKGIVPHSEDLVADGIGG